MDKAHEGKYTRIVDFGDRPLANKLMILTYEFEHVAETPQEKADALAAVKHMEAVIEQLTPKPAPEGGMARNPQHDLYHQRWA